MNVTSVKIWDTVGGQAGPRDINLPFLLATVSSYYGPGMVLAWLLVFISVPITWMFHKTQALTDTITYDLMAALAYPAVAAGHVIYLIAAFPGDRAQILTTGDPRLTPHAAEIDAALCVCDSFAILSLVLAAISMWKCQPRRFFTVMPVGMLCFEVGCALFWISPASSASGTNLSRPYSNMSRSTIVASNVFLGLLLLMAFAAWVRLFSLTRFSLRGQDNEALPAVSGDIRLAVASGQRAFRNIGRLPMWLSIIAIPLLAALAMTENLGVLGSTPLSKARYSYIFIPLTDVDLKDIDQIVKLCSGSITLLCSCYGVITSAIHSNAPGPDATAAASEEEAVELDPVH